MQNQFKKNIKIKKGNQTNGSSSDVFMQKQGQCIAGKLVWKTDKRRSPARFLNITWHLETHKPKQLSPDAQPVKTSILLGGGEAAVTPHRHRCAVQYCPLAVSCVQTGTTASKFKKSLSSLTFCPISMVTLQHQRHFRPPNLWKM